MKAAVVSNAANSALGIVPDREQFGASGGTLPGLRSQLEHLKIDYRDVIVAGEYVPKAGSLERIRNLDEPIDDEVGDTL